jgi:hypothetical protein
MQGHDVIVIGFSAGGLEPLLQLVADLPSDLPAELFVVHHFPVNSISALASILSRSADLAVRTARDREPVAPGTLTRLTREPALPPAVRPPDHQPGAMDVEAGSCRIRHILLQVAVPQALETPAEESEPGVGRRVATPSATGSHRQ